MVNAVVDRGALKDVLGILAKVNPKFNRIPALNCARLIANGDVELAATDLEVAVTVRLSRKVEGEKFQAILPIERLVKQVKASTCETTTFEPDGLSMRLDGNVSLVGQPVEDYPAILGDEGEFLASFDAQKFAAGIDRTIFARTGDVARYALKGVLLETVQKGRKGKESWHAALVASDGKRLALERLDPVRAECEARIILPPKTAEIVARVAAKAEPGALIEVYCSWTEPESKEKDPEPKSVRFVLGSTTIYSRVIDAYFPSWESVIPVHDPKTVYTVDRKALIEELARVAFSCIKEKEAVKFTLGDGKILLFTKSPDIGEAKGEVMAEGKGSLAIIFNPLYVLEFLRAQPKECSRVTLQVGEKDKAAIFRGAGGNEYILMPLTVNL